MPEEQRVVLYSHELSDVYALKTLQDYLKPDLEAKIVFSEKYFDEAAQERMREILCDYIKIEEEQLMPADVVIRTYCDIAKRFGENNSVLEIDASLLKNSALPMTKEQKEILRKKHDVVDKNNIAVISYTPALDCLTFKYICEIVAALHDTFFFYLVGSTKIEDIPSEYRKQVFCVNKKGILKDFYAIADVAINAENLQKRDIPIPLHNFVEATESGPLFMIEPRNTAQYGYKQLVEAGIIKTYHSFYQLIYGLDEYAKHSENESEVLAQKRTKHLLETRAKYLPLIEAQLKEMLKTASNTTDVYIRQHNVIFHHETNWSA